MFWGEEAANIDQWDSLWFNGREGKRLFVNNKPNKSMTRIILLSSNKQMDGMSQVSDDDPVISRVTSWQVLSTPIWLACLYMNTGKERHVSLPIRLLSMLSNCPNHVPNSTLQSRKCQEYLWTPTRTKGTVDRGDTMDWGSDTQELEWAQRRVRDSENGSKAEQQQKKGP